GMDELFYSGSRVVYEETGLYPPLHPRCGCAVQYIEVEAPKPFMRGVDVTKEYIDNATPGVGTVELEDGYEEATHKAEIETAEWLHKNLGGNIRLLHESNEQRVKTADYLWRDKLWDLKSVTSEKAANSAIRYGLHQIEENPGGIILNYGECDIRLALLNSFIEKRMQWYQRPHADILVLSRGELLEALRYGK
ncbi:MAG: hypothetical protein IJT94_16860, partial [Oscillibacter sp.]|nr:hypothetical protein [Oscillibacter sp.]